MAKVLEKLRSTAQTARQDLLRGFDENPKIVILDLFLFTLLSLELKANPRSILALPNLPQSDIITALSIAEAIAEHLWLHGRQIRLSPNQNPNHPLLR